MINLPCSYFIRFSLILSLQTLLKILIRFKTGCSSIRLPSGLYSYFIYSKKVKKRKEPHLVRLHLAPWKNLYDTLTLKLYLSHTSLFFLRYIFNLRQGLPACSSFIKEEEKYIDIYIYMSADLQTYM